MATSDDELLRKAASGDPGALPELLKRYGPVVRQRIAGKIPSHRQGVLSVDDVMQQTYFDAFLDIRQFAPRNGNSFIAWLTTLAEHNSTDALRMLDAEKRGGNRRRIEPRVSDESFVALYELLSGTRTTPSGHAAKNEARSCLEQALEQLPPDYRMVVEMYDLEGRAREDVAAALRRSVKAVYMLRKRAHRRLKEIMGTGSDYLGDSA